MILLIDNYDSFTYNLFQLVEELGHPCKVARNDAITANEVAALAPSAILISPGPGRPENSGVCLELVKRFAGFVPIFGVCLGLQAIGEAFGGNVVRAPRAKHGKVSGISHANSSLFRGVANPFPAARYHSLVVERSSLPACLEVTCETSDGLVMGLRHRSLAVEGVQFHPESVATVEGRRIVQNFLREIPRD
jgi:anthranilate synthase/aminodeoxychorismate synthase-like glutamine amidotransferase